MLKFLEKHLFDKIIARKYHEETFLRLLLATLFSEKPPQRLIKQAKEDLLGIRRERLEQLIKTNKLEKLVLKIIQELQLSDFLHKGLEKSLVKKGMVIEVIFNRRFKDSLKIMSSLAKARCDFVVLKTYLFRQKYFDGEAHKIVADLDLLVPVREFSKAYKVLLQDDYRYIPNLISLDKPGSISNVAFYAPKDQEFFVKGKYIVELHSTIVDTFDFYSIKKFFNKEINTRITQELFEKIEYVEVNGLRLKVFLPNQLFISLFLHTFLQHDFQGSISFYEAAVTIRKEKIDWKYVEFFIKKYRLTPFFEWYMCLLDDLFPYLLDKNLKRKIENYKRKFSLKQNLLFYFMRYKIFNPTNYLTNPERLKEKDWTWAIIGGKLFYVFRMRLTAKIIAMIKFILGYPF